MHSRTLLRGWAALAASVAMFAACGTTSDGSTELAGLEALPSPAGSGSAEPNFHVARDGRVLLSWLEAVDDSAHALRLSVLSGDGWSAPTTVTHASDLFVNWADFPSVVELPDGRFAAHWLQRSGTGRYAYDVRVAQSLDGGATWSAPVTPHRDGTQTEHGFVSLFPIGDSLGLVWLDGRKYQHKGHDGRNEMQLAFTTISADGGLGAEQFVDARVCDCCQTAAALTSSGPVVVYRDRSPEEIRDISIVRRVDGVWTEPAPVHRDGWHIAACPVNGPAIAANGDHVAVAWFTGADSIPAVKVAFSSDAGATFGNAVRLDEGLPRGRVGVVLDDAGGALVSWLELRDGNVAEVRVRRVATDGSLGTPMSVASTTGARASGFPRMVRAGDQLVFAWTAPDSQSQVRIARARIGTR